MRCFRVRLFVLFLALTFLSSAAFADILITTSTTAPALTPDEIALSLTDGANAPTVIGTLPGNISVSFSTPSVLDSLYVYTNDHPRIEAEDGSINILTIVPSTPVGDMLADIYGVYDADRDHVTVVVNASDGIHTLVLPMSIGQATSNYISIVATTGERINSISLGTDVDPARFHAIRDIYFSGIAQTPEPASMLLLGSGLLGIAGTVRLKLRG